MDEPYLSRDLVFLEFIRKVRRRDQNYACKMKLLFLEMGLKQQIYF